MFGLGKKKKIDKGAWAEAIYGKKLKNPEKESEAQLSVLTTGLLMQSHRIIMDSVRICRTTKNPDTYQGRIELCQKHYNDMLKLKPFCNDKQLAIIRNAEDIQEGNKRMKTFLNHVYRIMCAIVGIGGVAIAFEEGFSRDTVISIFLLLIVIVDLIFKTNISKFFAIFLMLPLIFAGWIFKGILGFFKRGKGKSKPYTLEEMLFYDELFDDKF